VRTHYGGALKGTEWLVKCPLLHPRYYLEDWLDLVLSWMKLFYVPDLFYLHQIELAEYERHRSDFRYMAEEPGMGAAREAAFEDFLRQFRTEADQWAREMGGDLRPAQARQREGGAP
jgi:hypothetical protein